MPAPDLGLIHGNGNATAIDRLQPYLEPIHLQLQFAVSDGVYSPPERIYPETNQTHVTAHTPTPGTTMPLEPETGVTQARAHSLTMDPPPRIYPLFGATHAFGNIQPILPATTEQWINELDTVYVHHACAWLTGSVLAESAYVRLYYRYTPSSQFAALATLEIPAGETIVGPTAVGPVILEAGGGLSMELVGGGSVPLDNNLEVTVSMLGLHGPTTPHSWES